MMLEITMQGVFYGIGRTIPPAIISISCNYMRIPPVSYTHLDVYKRQPMRINSLPPEITW